MKLINILLIEDDINISKIIKAYLEKEGFNILTAFNGEDGLKIFNEDKIHLIILDLMLPNLSGEEVCMRIRAISQVPIIMLTAKVEEENRIQGLTLGADDYVVKPFSPRELVERVKALLRRSYRKQPLANYFAFNNKDLEVYIGEKTVMKKGQALRFTNNEFKILLSFINNINQVLSREQLIRLSFGENYQASDRTIDTYIKNIRQLIEDKPNQPQYIQTVYGAGYKFVSI